MFQPIGRNARTGAIALAIFAPAHCLAGLAGAIFAPAAFACWLGISFGILCLCDELGAAKPLNRAGLVLFGAAFSARLLMVVTVEPATHVRAELIFAFATMGALLLWSVALMHRPRAPRTVGIFGTAIAGSTLALILSAHLLMGSATIWGFGTLFAALSTPTIDTRGAMAVINAILSLWGLVTAGLLRAHSLRAAQ
ncbi:hypothetical protein SAMN05444678_101202 [Sphingomonas sp. YR710]|uniref:hypothetical protein n=1 Tax=Sphingomonas sp. YR710 TaxID=1882773 RepID=UPI00088BB78A|nr:hypothetical protein [Sphingomonas sp. YR710]SDC04282.1 hypothetical protein SAMN05444678_101202 [Sphingomonas sp. YR710]